ncbi:MAG: DUF2892 domain-containing protein [Candidatus Saganbacteria bacterium]|nr:DUF2892 domain-containing protein [Candidatus Saganbacteria bacterium]
MVNNMSILDRIMRVVVAVLIAGLYLQGKIFGWWGIVLVVVGVIFVITGAIGYCPMYQICKCPTKKS